MTRDPIRSVRVTIELDPSSVPITGWFREEHRPQKEFHGMLELLSLLEAARERSPAQPSRPRA